MTRLPARDLFGRVQATCAVHRMGAGLACLLFVLGAGPSRLRAVDADRPASTPTMEKSVVRHCRPGPWGDVQYTRILIEPPDEFLAADYASADDIRWVLPGYRREGLLELWSAAGLSGAEARELANATSYEPNSGAAIVRPPRSLVLGLGARSRSVIYSALSQFSENPNQQEPFRFRADTAAEWFDHSGLTPATVSRVERLLYRRGNSLLFSDQDLVLPELPDRSERRKLVKTLARKATLLVQVRVGPDTHAEELARYWGRGPRRKDVGALLRSLANRPESTLIDISHLLPRFARSHVFTYPDVADHAGDANYDCHWTSLNFFNDPADARFADAATVKTTLENDYAPVEGQLLLGDVLVFFRSGGQAIHSCVYLADDIVFTKNGSSQVMPWIFMSLPDVLAFYPSEPPLQVRAYRHRGL